MTALRELITKIGFDVDEKTLNSVDKSIDNLRSKLSDFKDTTGNFSNGVSGFFSNIVDNFKNVVSQTNIANNSLGDLKGAAEKGGIKVNDFIESFNQFSKSVESDLGGVTSFFDTLGIALYNAKGEVKSFNKLYVETAKKVNALQNKNLQSTLGKELFGQNHIQVSETFGKASFFDQLSDSLKRFKSNFDNSFDKMKSKVGDFNISIKSLRGAFLKISAIFIGTFSTLSLLGLSVSNSIKEFNNLSRTTGVSVKELKEFELISQQSGLKVNSFTDSLTSFKSKLDEAASSSGGTFSQFQTLGISIRENNGNLRNSLDLYTEVARKLNGLKDESKKAKLAQDFFGNSGVELTAIMGQSADALEKQRKEVEALTFKIDAKAIKTAERYNKSWVNFKSIISNVKHEIGLSLLPSLTNVNDKLKNWYVLNKDIIHQRIDSFFNAIGKSLEFTINIVVKVIDAFGNITNALGGFENFLIIISTVLAAKFIPVLLSMTPAILAAAGAIATFAVAILSNPITWLIGAIILLASELYHWVQGNDSLVGRVLGTWVNFKNKMGDVFDNIKNVARDTIDKIKKWFEDFDPIAIVKNKLGKLGDLFDLSGMAKSGVDKINGLFDNVRQKTIFREVPKSQVVTVSPNSYKDELQNLSKLEINKEPIGGFNNNGGLNSLLEPVISPLTTNNSNRSFNNKVINNINENITINVPKGTTEEQSKAIADQVTGLIQDHFDYNVLRALDSLGNT